MDTTLLIIFATSFGVGLSGALMPGPLLTVTVSESARRGFRAGPMLVAGHGIAEVLLLISLALGLSRLLAFGSVKGAIAVLGGCMLLWMGYGIVSAVWRREVSLKAVVAADTANTSRRYMLTGATVTVSNPYWIVWWATAGAALLSGSLKAGALGILVFYIGHILSDLTWYSLISGIVASGGRLINDSIYRTLLGACGLFLLALGLYFTIAGAKVLLGLAPDIV